MVAAIAIALALGAAPPGAVATAAPPGRVGAELALDVRVDLQALHDQGIATSSAAQDDADLPSPPCLADVCQPVVAVPGFEPRYDRVHRSELFVLALERAHVEPLASMAWALVATGVRLDWTPPALDGRNVDRNGWGSVMLRLRVRLDATNRLVFPRRPSS